MKNFCVLTLFAMFVTTSLFLGCDEGMKMMKPAVEDSTEEEKESTPEPTRMPTVESIKYYFAPELIPEAELLAPHLIAEVVYIGVVFSDNVPLVIADDETVSPDIRFVTASGEIPFHIVPHGSSDENFQGGDCKPVEENRVFLCKVVGRENTSFVFSVKAITENGMMQSDSLRLSDPDAPLPDDLDGIPPREPEVPEEPEQPVRPGEEPLPELEAWSQATNTALGTIRLMELRELKPQYKFGDSISEETEEVLIERTGLTWEQLKNLTDICLVESGDIVFVEKLKRFVAFTDILANYVQLTLIHPEKTESEILDLFTERCKRRVVTAEASVVAEDYYGPQYLEDLQWEWEQTLNEDEEEEEGGEEEGDGTAPLPEG